MRCRALRRILIPGLASHTDECAGCDVRFPLGDQFPVPCVADRGPRQSRRLLRRQLCGDTRSGPTHRHLDRLIPAAYRLPDPQHTPRLPRPRPGLAQPQPAPSLGFTNTVRAELVIPLFDPPIRCRAPHAGDHGRLPHRPAHRKRRPESLLSASLDPQVVPVVVTRIECSLPHRDLRGHTPQGGSGLLAAETSFTEKEELRAQPLVADIEMDSGGASGVFETSSVADQP